MLQADSTWSLGQMFNAEESFPFGLYFLFYTLLVFFKTPFIRELVSSENILINCYYMLLAGPSPDIGEVGSRLGRQISGAPNFREKNIDLKDTTFPATKEIRVRKKNRLFNYELPDEPIVNPQENFKNNFFYSVLDTAIQSVSERFNQLEDHNSNFGFLYNINSLSKETQNYLLKKCQNLERILTHGDSKDIDALQLCDELISISHRMEGEGINSPHQLLQYICKNRMCEIFSNLTVALRILLTLPVTVASGERSFSKLKLIENYLRTSMTQNRLVNLAILSIEKEIAAGIDLTLVVREFAEAKARRVKF